MARPHRDGREEWLHGDYLAYDRLAERRARAAQAALVAESRSPRATPQSCELAARVVRVVRLLL